MKRAIKILWTIVAIAALIFVFVMFTAESDVKIWETFSVTMPIIGVGFWSAVILSVIDFIRSKK